MLSKIKYQDLGLLQYKEAWEFQERLFNERVNLKLFNRENPSDNPAILDDILLFVEHPHVYTLGKSGNQNNLLIKNEFLAKIQATYYHTDRGGDITYHGPGQIVGYPIFDLEHFGIHLKQYVYGIEESIILFLHDLGIQASRLEGATGVWIQAGTSRERKICALGVKGSRHITMHGFALNINTDLQYFSYINPCGFEDKGVTSLEKELGIKQDLDQLKNLLQAKIIHYFQALPIKD
ncbi:MAG: lipoyl(octanoyl) transferase LipB [Bacteroidales bacterium]|nr:lipoyl(octanoyl) transferase LipB [Bacteroidales bacterium]